MFFSDGRHFKLRYALTVAKQIYGKINEQKEHLEWPLVRRTGKTWFPTAKWVGSWFAGIGWKPRKATKKRKATSAQDCAAMQKYCDFLRYVIQCPPPQADAALEPHMDWGYYKPDVRFNRDQVGLQFDFNGYSKTWASPEERSTNCIAVATGPEAWSKRYCTWDMTYSADLTGPQMPAILYLRGKGRVSEVERMSYHPDVQIIWTPKGYLNRDANKAWLDLWKQWKDEKMPDRHALLTCDSVDPQALKSFRECMEATGTYVLHGPTGSTHVWQMIDRHVGKMHKDLLAEEQLEYLADDDHNAGFSSLSASDRRVLLTYWVGAAREIYIASKRKQHKNCCAASGLLLTLTGKGRMPSVESSPVFALQAYQQWEGLTDAIEGSWKDDVQNVESDGSSDSSSSSTSSSSSSDSNPDSLPDVPDHAAVEEVDQANQQLAEPAVPEPVPENLVSVEDLVHMLSSAKARNKGLAGAQMLAGFARCGTAVQHPSKCRGQKVVFSRLKEAAKAVGIDVWEEMGM